MGQRIATTSSVVAAGIAAVTLLATVSPHTASSNVSKWLRHVNVDVPAFLSSPSFDVVLRWCSLGVLILVFAYWIWRVIRLLLGRRRAEKRWVRREFISIQEAAELISNQGRSFMRRHRLKYEVTNELIGLVQDGRIPVANEKADQGHGIVTLAAGDLRLYPRKTASPDTLLDRTTLENVARGRNWQLPQTF